MQQKSSVAFQDMKTFRCLLSTQCFYTALPAAQLTFTGLQTVIVLFVPRVPERPLWQIFRTISGSFVSSKLRFYM